jgi:multisubunit Na+/H+ antiporter MnhG subunit
METTLNDIELKNNQSNFLINIGAVFSMFAALGISVVTNDIIKNFVYSYGSLIGVAILLIASIVLFINNKK